MKLDRTFEKEIKETANGDGSKEAKFAFLRRARDAKNRLSSHEVMREFDSILREFGRATVGVCVAVTIMERKAALQSSAVRWAEEVLKLWTNRPDSIRTLYIADNLHPSRIQEYAGALIRFTIEG